MAYIPPNTLTQSSSILSHGHAAVGTGTRNARVDHAHDSPQTAKGSLQVSDGSGANELNTLTVGADNTHLIANSGATYGLQWNAPTLWLPASAATLDVTAALSSLGAAPDQLRVAPLLDAVTDGVFWNFIVPYDWVSGVITAQMVWSPGATDNTPHTVRWSMDCKNVVSGGDVTAAGTTTAFNGSSAARTISLLVKDTATSTGITPTAAGDLFMIDVRRIGGDAVNDTYVGTVNLVGVIITY